MIEEQRIKGRAHIKAAFRSFTEARQSLTIWEFQDHIAKNLVELGSQGFVASIGAAIVAASNQQSTTEPKCTCPEDWQGMDHTEGCKSRASR